MSFDRVAVETQLIRVLDRAVSMTWALADQAFEAAQPYGTVKVIAHEAIGSGEPDELPADGDITERMREHFVVRVSINAIGRDAMDTLSTVKTYLRRPSVTVGAKNELELAVQRIGEVRDLAQVMDGDWEGRAQMDAVFGVAFESDLTVATVGSVEIRGAGSTQTVEVPQA